MALEKEIILENGIKANYHRIKEVQIDFIKENITVLVDSYVNSNIRENQKNIKKLEESVVSYAEKYEKAYQNNDDALMKSLEDKLNTMSLTYNKEILKNFVANQATINLEHFDDTNLSISNFYKLISKLDNYKKAKKV